MTDDNRRWWDERVPLHAASEFYDLASFRAGAELPHSLWLLDEVGDVDEPGTYVDPKAPTVHNRTTEWNHGLGQVVTALIEAGLVLEFLFERVEIFNDFTGWLAEKAPGVWAAPEGELPLLYSLRARKPAG